MLRGQLRQLLATVKAVRQGDFSARFPIGDGIVSEIGDVLNDIIELNGSLAAELVRVAKIVGQEGKLTESAPRLVRLKDLGPPVLNPLTSS